MGQQQTYKKPGMDTVFSVHPLWHTPKEFVEKWGRPYIIKSLGDGWILSTVDFRDISSTLLLLDENFKVTEVLFSGKHFMRFYFDKQKQAIFFLESDLMAFQNRRSALPYASSLSRLDMKTKSLTSIFKGNGKSFFAMNLAPLEKGRLVISDIANKQLVILSPSGEQLGLFDIGKKLAVSMTPNGDGIYFTTYSSINSYFRTSDPYDSIYHMNWDGDLRRIHNTGLPGVPGNIYGMYSMENKIIYSSYHSITMIDKRGEILWELPMTAQVWKKERQSYCVGIFPDSNSSETMQAISWGDKHDVIWNITADTKEKHHAESGST